MKTYLRHKVLNVIDIKELTALEYLLICLLRMLSREKIPK